MRPRARPPTVRRARCGVEVVIAGARDDGCLRRDARQVLEHDRDLRVGLDAEGNNVGVVPTRQALIMADEAALDLVEISPDAKPPVAKILDYGKFKFQEQKRLAEARKKQRVVELKEIKLRPMIDDHDYEVKMKAAKRFFDEGDKVKVTLRFRGREMDHQELGHKLLNKVKADTTEIAKVELEPRFEGRQIIMILAPRAQKQ